MFLTKKGEKIELCEFCDGPEIFVLSMTTAKIYLECYWCA
jgi:hypothetical protein